MLDSVADFGLGETIRGKNDDNVDINTALEGREYTFPVTEAVATASGMSNRVVGRRVVARIMRNNHSAALNAGEIVAVDVANGHAGLGSATALSSANDRYALVVDPALGDSTVAVGDLFYAIVKGPTKVKQPASPVNLAAGALIKAGASGRLAAGAVSTDGGRLLGTVVKANNVANALVEVELAPDAV